MKTLTLSAHSLGIYSRCPSAYHKYKILQRRLVRQGTGQIAGTAFHAATEALHRGLKEQEQDAAIDNVLEATPTPVDDYRQGAYLRDAFAAFRAEHQTAIMGWTIEEVEAHGFVDLGIVEYQSHTGDVTAATVRWEFRRDLVASSPSGRRFLWDFKTASRNELAHVESLRNSSALKGYVWSWRQQHPDKPILGVQPCRAIFRKPSRTGVAFEFPKDGEIYFTEARLDEWHRNTLRKARELLERDPDDWDAWPMADNEIGCCRHQYGLCDYFGVCLLDPADRALKLSTDEFEPSDTGKRRDAVATND